MKTWKRPEAVGQKFTANEYVSACALEVLCDFEIPEGFLGLAVSRGQGDLDGDGWDDFGMTAYPCKEVHVVGRDTEFKTTTFTRGVTEWEDVMTGPLSNSVEIVYWNELNADGKYVDTHWTTQENVANAGSNKS